MKVTGVTSTLYRYRCARPFDDARSPHDRVTVTSRLVELKTDEGLVGVGIGGERSGAEIEGLVGDVLLGQDPCRVTGLWQRMADLHFDRRTDVPTGEAIAVLDMALWDLKSKANGEPLWKTLGGARPKANVYASDAGLPISDDALFRWYAGMASDYGFREGKLKVGLDRESDRRRLNLMREALDRQPGEPVLMIEADEYWSPKEAVRSVREMEKAYDLTWVEAPAPRWDVEGLKRVSESVRAAVCAGGRFCSHREFMPHWYRHSLDVVQIDPSRTGITGALQLADAAYGYELPVTLTASPGNVHAHLAGAMPYFMSMEVFDPMPQTAIFSTDVRIASGWARIGDRPGNGLIIDYEALAAARVDSVPNEALVRRAGGGLLALPPAERPAGKAPRD